MKTQHHIHNLQLNQLNLDDRIESSQKKKNAKLILLRYKPHQIHLQLASLLSSENLAVVAIQL
jgi:hypothetical protein